jgi:transposase
MSIIAHVGIDAHEETLAICVPPCDESTPIRFSCRNIASDIASRFGELATRYDLRCCYEASSGGYVLQRLLSKLGIKCEVVAPSLIPKKVGDKVKTDKRDAFDLAHLYQSRLLTTVYVPTPEQVGDRHVVRYRASVQADVVATKNEMNKFLTSHGIQNPFKSRWTLKYWAWIKQLKFADSDQFVRQQMICMLEFELCMLGVVDAKLADIAQKKEYKERTGKLCCLRGVGVPTALTLGLELVDATRFPDARALTAYVGLTPSERSSGKSRKQGGITKTGNSHLRRVLVEAAWKDVAKPATGTALRNRQAGQPAQIVGHAWKAQHRLHKKFWSVANRKERPVAAVATARELVGFIWAIMTTPVASA